MKEREREKERETQRERERERERENEKLIINLRANKIRVKLSHKYRMLRSIIIDFNMPVIKTYSCFSIFFYIFYFLIYETLLISPFYV
jgi:hypothetical protein